MLDYTHNIKLLSYFDKLLSQNDVGKQDFFLKCCNRCTLIDILADDFENSRVCSHIVFIRAGFENAFNQAVQKMKRCTVALKIYHYATHATFQGWSKYTIIQLTQSFRDTYVLHKAQKKIREKFFSMEKYQKNVRNS